MRDSSPVGSDIMSSTVLSREEIDLDIILSSISKKTSSFLSCDVRHGFVRGREGGREGGGREGGREGGP